MEALTFGTEQVIDNAYGNIYIVITNLNYTKDAKGPVEGRCAAIFAMPL